MVDNVPKLLPSWHDITLQDFIRRKYGHKFSSSKPPDYGGIGLDVNINDKVHCRIPKYAKCQIRFAADKCALPFFPLQKINEFTDPCLQNLKKEKLNLEKFSAKLDFVRRQVSQKSFASNLQALQHKINSYNTETQNQEFNIHVPKSVVQLTDSLPKHIVVPAFNVAYAGGTLAICTSSDKLNLLHPNSETMSQLCITPLVVGNDQHFMPEFSGKRFINLENEPILQVESALDGFSCVRQTNSFHLVNMTNSNVFSETTDKHSLYHIASSPYNPMEILAIYEKGIMEYRNMETRKTLWNVSEDIYDDPFIFYPTWRCSFGSHPFSVLSLNEKNLYCFDFREKKITARQIFKVEKASCYINEELYGMKQWNKNPFQYLLTSSHHLFICDERYPNTPVMSWNHCLKDPPVYLECADFDSNVSFIVIGTQGSQQVASFLCSHQEDIQPVSLSTPLLLSSPTDCINSLRLHCYYISDKISTRLSSPLTGVCVVPNNNKIGFTVIQSTSMGDIFYQDFKQSSDATEKTYRVSIGCVLTPPEKILPHLSNLLSDTDSSEVERTKDADEAIAHIVINIDKVLNPPTEISSNCMLCRSGNASDDKGLVSSEACPSCNLSTSESEHFSKALANDSVIIGSASVESNILDCDMDYLSKFDDIYSKKILSLWLESDNASRRESRLRCPKYVFNKECGPSPTDMNNIWQLT